MKKFIFRNSIFRILSRHSNRAKGFSIVESLVALGVTALVIAFAAFAGYRFLKKNSETAYQIKQYESVQTARKRINDLINSAVFISARETVAPGLYGISSTYRKIAGGATGEKGDVLQIIGIQPGSSGALYSVLGAFSDSASTTLTLKDPKNPSPTVPYFNVGDWIYLAGSTWTDATQVTNVNGNIVTLEPPVAHKIGTNESILGVRLGVKTLHIRDSDSALVLSSVLSSDPNLENFGSSDPVRREVIMQGASKFFISYQMERKQTQYRSDSCHIPDPIEAYRYQSDTQGLNFPGISGLTNCNYNNLVRVRVELEYQNVKDTKDLADPSKQFTTLTWTTQPFRFLAANWGDFANIDLNGASILCDDRMESQRCLPECAGQYRAMNHHYDQANSPDINGLMGGEDFEPNSDYCDCKTGAGFDWASIAGDKTRYGSCCKYRQTLQDRWQARNPGNSDAVQQYCQFQWCERIPRADNPYQAICAANPTCGKSFPFRSCLWPDLQASDGTKPMADMCNPARSNPKIDTVIENLASSWGNTFAPGTPPPLTNSGSVRIDPVTGDRLTSLTANMYDSQMCQCFKQLYSFNSSSSGNSVTYRQFTLTESSPGSGTFTGGIPGHQYTWKFPSLLTGGQLSFSEHDFDTAPHVITVANGAIAIDGKIGEYELPILKPISDNRDWTTGWQRCFDPLWDAADSSVPSGKNYCRFEATNSGGKNTIIRAPFDPDSAPWALGDMMPGNRTLNGGGAVDGFNQNTNISCACYRAGLPHDPVASLNADFNGFIVGGLLASVVGAGNHCSCINPVLASKSTANLSLGASEKDRLDKICEDCGNCSSGGGTTGTGGDTTGGTGLP